MIRDLRQVPEDVKKAVRGFFLDAKRLVQASRSTSALIFITFLFIGLWPVLELITLYGLLDALIGARGIGTWTKDITTFLWYQIALMILLVPAVFVSQQFTGTARRIGIILAETLMIASLFIAALPIAPILLFLILVAAFISHYFTNRFLMLGYSIVTLLLASWSLYSIFQITVHRGATVGEAILYAGSLLTLSFWLALRPHLKTV